ncbi:unnamed protein product [Effrenium voratum]|uniref:SAP domain-containing protein n=1 Tax=Effrenium voratum TaxID=2562239 RepID=A0AA36HPP0_9DINO|nr:unnamed protein product [Effrenium voratum]
MPTLANVILDSGADASILPVHMAQGHPMKVQGRRLVDLAFGSERKRWQRRLKGFGNALQEADKAAVVEASEKQIELEVEEPPLNDKVVEEHAKAGADVPAVPRDPDEIEIDQDGELLNAACSLRALRTACEKWRLPKSGGKQVILKRLWQHQQSHKLVEDHKVVINEEKLAKHEAKEVVPVVAPSKTEQAVPTPAKGGLATEMLAAAVVRFMAFLGYSNCILKCDNEANGQVEQAGQAIRYQACILLSQLEEGCKMKIPTGAPYGSRLVQFGESVMAHVKDAEFPILEDGEPLASLLVNPLERFDDEAASDPETVMPPEEPAGHVEITPSAEVSDVRDADMPSVAEKRMTEQHPGTHQPALLDHEVTLQDEMQQMYTSEKAADRLVAKNRRCQWKNWQNWMNWPKRKSWPGSDIGSKVFVHEIRVQLEVQVAEWARYLVNVRYDGLSFEVPQDGQGIISQSSEHRYVLEDEYDTFEEKEKAKQLIRQIRAEIGARPEFQATGSTTTTNLAKRIFAAGMMRLLVQAGDASKLDEDVDALGRRGVEPNSSDNGDRSAVHLEWTTQDTLEVIATLYEMETVQSIAEDYHFGV